MKVPFASAAQWDKRWKRLGRSKCGGPRNQPAKKIGALPKCRSFVSLGDVVRYLEPSGAHRE